MHKKLINVVCLDHDLVYVATPTPLLSRWNIRKCKINALFPDEIELRILWKKVYISKQQREINLKKNQPPFCISLKEVCNHLSDSTMTYLFIMCTVAKGEKMYTLFFTLQSS